MSLNHTHLSLRFTIITNTIRRPLELVEKSVDSSLNQDGVTEVILVDQNQRATVFNEKITANPRFQHLHRVVPAVSMARNLAEYSKDTEWLIFCDDDGYLEASYLSKLTELISQFPNVEIFAGSIKRIDNQEYYSKRHAVGGNMDHFWNTKLLMGSNFVIKRKVFEELGKFDERFGAGAKFGSSEETDLAWSAYFSRKKMRYSPELVVFHVPPFVGDYKMEVAKAFRYGYGKGRLVRKWLAKGKWVVLFEFFEMTLLPIARYFSMLITFRWKAARIQMATLAGRFAGLV